MIGVLGHDSILVRLYWAGTTWANEVNLVMNYAPGAGSIARHVYSQCGSMWIFRNKEMSGGNEKRVGMTREDRDEKGWE